MASDLRTLLVVFFAFFALLVVTGCETVADYRDKAEDAVERVLEDECIGIGFERKKE